MARGVGNPDADRKGTFLITHQASRAWAGRDAPRPNKPLGVADLFRYGAPFPYGIDCGHGYLVFLRRLNAY
jgi:hypothetical protein